MHLHAWQASSLGESSRVRRVLIPSQQCGLTRNMLSGVEGRAHDTRLDAKATPSRHLPRGGGGGLTGCACWALESLSTFGGPGSARRKRGAGVALSHERRSPAWVSTRGCQPAVALHADTCDGQDQYHRHACDAAAGWYPLRGRETSATGVPSTTLQK